MRQQIPPSLTFSYLPIIEPVGIELRHEFTFDHFRGRHTSPFVADSFSLIDSASELPRSQSSFPRVSTLTPCRPSVRQAGHSAPALCAYHPYLFTLDNLSEVSINRTAAQTAQVNLGFNFPASAQAERGSAGRFLVSSGALRWPDLAKSEIVLGSKINYENLGLIGLRITSYGR